jgi:hypothetical protein
VGGIVPALRHGERRLFIDAELCLELKTGLQAALAWLRHWYYTPDHLGVRIEAKTRSRIPAISSRAGFFFSGGIDSLATLRANRLSARAPRLLRAECGAGPPAGDVPARRAGPTGGGPRGRGHPGPRLYQCAPARWRGRVISREPCWQRSRTYWCPVSGRCSLDPRPSPH